MSVLRIDPDGSLQLVPDGVVSSDGPTPVSIAVHDNLVYVANAGAAGPNYTGFTLNPSHNGQFLFTVNTGSGEISRYAIAPNGSLALLGSTPVSDNGGVGAVDPRLSNDGRTLYIDESQAGTVAAFAVNGGNLTELPSSPVPLPAGAHAAGIVTTGFQ